MEMPRPPLSPDTPESGLETATLAADAAATEEAYVEEIDRGHPLLRFASAAIEREFRDHYRLAGRRRIQVGLIAAFWVNLLSAPLTAYVFLTAPDIAHWYQL